MADLTQIYEHLHKDCRNELKNKYMLLTRLIYLIWYARSLKMKV